MMPETAIRSATLDEYLQTRAHRYSSDALRFDDPDRPLPDEAAERKWWVDEVASGRYVCHAILELADGLSREGHLVGLICAFCFDCLPGQCETGIVIFPPDRWKRGHAGRAYRLFLEWLAARALFARLGFAEESRTTSGGIEWLILRRTLEAFS